MRRRRWPFAGWLPAGPTQIAAIFGCTAWNRATEDCAANRAASEGRDASTAGKGLSEAVAGLFPDMKMVRVPGQSDLMFLCEQGGLTFAELAQLLKPCRAAYEAAAGSPLTSPHARFDVTDWLPLEP